MFQLLASCMLVVAAFSAPIAHAATTTAYNTFLVQPQRFGQVAGFSYYGGAQVGGALFGNTFIPTVSGMLSDVWIAIGSSLADNGTDIVHVYLATTDAQNLPEFALAEAVVQGELSKRESIVHIPAGDPDIFLQAGQLYWLLLAPGEGTPEVAWLGGPPNAVPGANFGYFDINSPDGWYMNPANANGAMRIDVSAVPEPSTSLMFASGLIALLAYVRLRQYA